MTTNGNRERIISLIQSAQHQIQVAVSWLTDESIIQALTSVADGLNVELILSQDPLNAAFRYPNIRTLQKAGASVLKAGAQFPGEKGFMHAKFMVIDDKEIYDGSFNFTDAASYNYENFAMYDGREMTKLKSDFESWKEGAVDYTVGFENPEKINQLVRDQFEQNERIRKLMREQCKIGFDKSAKEERDSLIQLEIEKERLRRQAKELAEGSKGISPKGSLIDGPKATVVKKHRHYGGTFMGDFGNRKRKNSHSVAQRHMGELQRRFPFVSCRIKDDTLVCRGTFQPDGCDAYDFRIEHRAGESPQVFITNIDIANRAECHIYSNGSLCLYYPGDQKWTDRTSIADCTIPWIYEWIVNYELYKLTGVWETDFVPHGTIQRISPNE